MIYEEINELWTEVQGRAPELAQARRIDVRTLIADAETQAAETSAQLQPWLAVSELAIEFLFVLYRFALDVRAGTDIPSVFVFQVGRACSYAVSIRRLALGGQEDAARLLVRSLFEGMDIALVALADDDFAQRLNFAESDLERKIWREEIGYGQIQRRAAAVAVAAGFDDAEKVARRREDADVLSSSVHASFRSAFRSAAVFSLAHPGGIVLSPLGHISGQTPHLLDRIAVETHEFAAVVLRFVMGEDPPAMFAASRVQRSEFFHSMFATFFLLQEAVGKYGDSIVAYDEQLRRRIDSSEPENADHS